MKFYFKNVKTLNKTSLKINDQQQSVKSYEKITVFVLLINEEKKIIAWKKKKIFEQCSLITVWFIIMYSVNLHLLKKNGFIFLQQKIMHTFLVQ